jgi:hypothetical protein
MSIRNGAVLVQVPIEKMNITNKIIILMNVTATLSDSSKYVNKMFLFQSTYLQ